MKINRQISISVLLVILEFLSSGLFAANYYVSPTGNDNYPGTIDAPFKTWGKLGNVLHAGDIGYIRGGTYTNFSTTYWYQCRWNNLNGTVTDTIKIMAYPGETPVWDFTGHNFGTATRYLIQMNQCNYVLVKGLRLTQATQPSTSPIIAWNIVNSNNVVLDNCTVDHIGGVGFKIGDEGWGTGDSNIETTYNILYKNCDSYANDDPTSPNPHDGADGFGINHNTSRIDKRNYWATNITYNGCRSWFNADDGWDFFGCDSTGIILNNCWAFFNGKSSVDTSLTGNGVGYKLGPNYIDKHEALQFTITNCIAIKNRGNGFDQNTMNYTSIHILYNNFTYANGGIGFMFGYNKYYTITPTAHIFRNNSSLANSILPYDFDPTLITNDHNSWNNGVNINSADFTNLQYSQLFAPRKTDGSLPDLTFGHLVSNSDLINSGINVGLPFNGSAPDIGAFEYSSNSTNNLPPSIQNQGFNINENSPNGTTVGTVLASDPDPGQIITFSIVSGNTNGAFVINATTGVLTVANTAALNFEVTPSFALVVKVQDNGTGNLSSQATVTISLTNVNEAPVINNQAFSIAENSANGATVGTVIATDPDAGQTKTFSIVSGNTSGAFAINASTAVLTVANTAALNFEATPSFALVVKVQDNGTGNLSSQATVTISLTNVNEVPVVNDQVFSVQDFANNGTSVGTILATDPDAGQTLTYTLLSGNSGNAFTLNSSTGLITVATSSAINYTVNPTFTLNVKVTDNGTGSLFDNANITINVVQATNQVPIINNQSFILNENAPNGTIIGTILAVDPDAGQVLTYQLISGNASGAFSINASTGVLSVANTTALNFEITPSFALGVRVQDNGTGNLSSQATVSVTLTDINESPVVIDQLFYVQEFAANGTYVGTIVATDPDAGQTLTYTINSGNSDNGFSLNPATGEITVNNFSAINYTVNPSFTLSIKVTDNGTGSLFDEANITINVTQFPNHLPVINNQSFLIAENSFNGSILGTIYAYDPDEGQTLTFSIVSGNDNSAFTVGSTSGILSVSNSAAINYEVSPSFGLVVKVQDNGVGNLSNQALISITLTDINEAPIINNQSFTLAENSANGSIVGTVIATDPDAGQIKTFSIVSGNTNGAFTINLVSGVLSIANSSALNFEEISSFALEVKVQDNGTGNLSNQAIIAIAISDINEAPAVNDQQFSIAENSVNGTNIGYIIATDQDIGQTLSYSLLSGNTGNAFNINSSTGLLTVANSSAINYYVNPSFILNIKVTDNGSNQLFDNANITIDVSQFPNQTPVISDQFFTVAENSANATTIGTLVASDPDAGQILSYSIVSGNSNGTFALNSISGKLTVANSSYLNFETTPDFKLVVEVKDNGTGNLSKQANIFISLIDINEVPTIYNQVFSIRESDINGTLAGTVQANDPDYGQALTYFIVSGNTNNAFSIDNLSGNITINNSTAINYFSNPVFILKIKVSDNGTGTLFNEAIVTINVLKKTNQSPVIVNQNFSIVEKPINGSIVGKVVASDPDIDQTLSYYIISGNTNNAFSIDPLSGLLTITNSAAIDFSSNSKIILTIMVKDNGEGNLSNQCEITILLKVFNEGEDINENDVLMYPNPTNGILNINCEKLRFNTFSIEVCDLSGKKLFHKDYSDKELKTLDLSYYQKGTYLIMIRAFGVLITKKIILY